MTVELLETETASSKLVFYIARHQHTSAAAKVMFAQTASSRHFLRSNYGQVLRKRCMRGDVLVSYTGHEGSQCTPARLFVL